jgi:TusA-related sulfurtransferase
MEKARVDKTLDIKGINSPRLQELTVNTMEAMYSGQVLRVITDDSSTRTSIPALCDKRGYMLVKTEEYDGALHYTIQK